MNRYEVRQALRKIKQDKKNKNQKEVRAMQKHEAEKRYVDAFTFVFGHPPKVTSHPSLSALRLNRAADKLYAQAHARELGGQDEAE